MNGCELNFYKKIMVNYFQKEVFSSHVISICVATLYNIKENNIITLHSLTTWAPYSIATTLRSSQRIWMSGKSKFLCCFHT